MSSKWDHSQLYYYVFHDFLLSFTIFMLHSWHSSIVKFLVILPFSKVLHVLIKGFVSQTYLKKLFKLKSVFYVLALFRVKYIFYTSCLKDLCLNYFWFNFYFYLHSTKLSGPAGGVCRSVWIGVGQTQNPNYIVYSGLDEVK